MTKTTNEKRIGRYARQVAKLVISLRAERTDWADAEAARLTQAAQERCELMRMGRL